MRRADIIKFDINGREFYVYEGNSGTEALVDGRLTPIADFFNSIVDSLGIAAPLLHNVLCHTAMCLEAREQDVDFTINGVQFHCFKHSLGRGRNAVPHQYKVGRGAVTARLFNSRMGESLGRSLPVVRQALQSIDRNFIDTARAA